MESFFITGAPADSSDKKSIYINEDREKLVLSADLKVDFGKVTVESNNLSNDVVVGSESYGKDVRFNTELMV